MTDRRIGPARVVVYQRERGQVVMSTPDGVVRLSAVQARQLALDLNRASLPPRPDPEPVGHPVTRTIGTVLSYAIPVAILALIVGYIAVVFVAWLLNR